MDPIKPYQHELGDDWTPNDEALAKEALQIFYPTAPPPGTQTEREALALMAALIGGRPLAVDTLTAIYERHEIPPRWTIVRAADWLLNLCQWSMTPEDLAERLLCRARARARRRATVDDPRWTR